MEGSSAVDNQIFTEASPLGSKTVEFTKSVCPECYAEGKINVIDAVILEKQGKIYIKKSCPEHDTFEDLYWGDAELYYRARRFADPGIRIENPAVVDSGRECPAKCGLCDEHESHTGLANVVVTNRCNLSCWYCFFYAKPGSRIYEPDLSTIERMFITLREEKPIGTEAVQLTGGEPTLRDDLLEIIKLAKKTGFKHLLLNTNGIELSRDPELARKVKEAASGMNIVLYMSFDGVSKKTNPKNYYEIPGVIENCRKAKLSIVLVPTVIKGVNDHEVGDILRFALAHNDVVRGVNFQPVSLVGKMPREEREKRRITIPDVIHRIEEQTNGGITREDFFPVPSTTRLTNFLETLFNTRKHRLSTHFACGMATYVFMDNGRLVPITRFFDVEGFLEHLKELEQEIRGRRFKLAGKGIAAIKAVRALGRFVDSSKAPRGLNFKRLLLAALAKGSYSEFISMHVKSLFIGMMHFQDTYNYDIARVKKCSVHYAMPDGRIVPFCTFNVFPDFYRDKVQEKYSLSQEEWEQKTGKRLGEEKYRRNFSPDEIQRIDRFYEESLARIKF